MGQLAVVAVLQASCPGPGGRGLVEELVEGRGSRPAKETGGLQMEAQRRRRRIRQVHCSLTTLLNGGGEKRCVCV